MINVQLLQGINEKELIFYIVFLIKLIIESTVE